MKTCFDHNFSKSANPDILQKPLIVARFPLFEYALTTTRAHERAEKSKLSARPKNAAAPSLLELLELLTPGAKKKCCMLNYLQMFIAPKLCAINADPSENLHTSSTDRDWDLIKIWTQTVLITKSYDQNKFQLFLLKKTIRFHQKAFFLRAANILYLCPEANISA